MIRMRVCNYEIVELLDIVTFQRLDYVLALARIASIDEDRFTTWRRDQNRGTIDRAYIKGMNLEFATRRGRRRGLPPGIDKPVTDVATRHSQQYKVCSGTTAPSRSSSRK